MQAILLPIQHPTIHTPIAHFISPKVDPANQMYLRRRDLRRALLVLSLKPPRGWALMMEADDEMIEKRRSKNGRKRRNKKNN